MSHLSSELDESATGTDLDESSFVGDDESSFVGDDEPIDLHSRPQLKADSLPSPPKAKLTAKNIRRASLDDDSAGVPAGGASAHRQAGAAGGGHSSGGRGGGHTGQHAGYVGHTGHTGPGGAPSVLSDAESESTYVETDASTVFSDGADDDESFISHGSPSEETDLDDSSVATFNVLDQPLGNSSSTVSPTPPSAGTRGAPANTAPPSDSNDGNDGNDVSGNASNASLQSWVSQEDASMGKGGRRVDSSGGSIDEEASMESYDSEKESELGDQTSTSSIAAGGGSIRATSPTAAKNGTRNTNASSAGGGGSGGGGTGGGGRAGAGEGLSGNRESSSGEGETLSRAGVAGEDDAAAVLGKRLARLASSSLPPAVALDGQQPLGAKRGAAVVGDGSSSSIALADKKESEGGASGGMDVLLEQLTGLPEARAERAAKEVSGARAERAAHATTPARTETRTLGGEKETKTEAAKEEPTNPLFDANTAEPPAGHVSHATHTAALRAIRKEHRHAVRKAAKDHADHVAVVEAKVVHVRAQAEKSQARAVKDVTMALQGEHAFAQQHSADAVAALGKEHMKAREELVEEHRRKMAEEKIRAEDKVKRMDAIFLDAQRKAVDKAKVGLATEHEIAFRLAKAETGQDHADVLDDTITSLREEHAAELDAVRREAAETVVSEVAKERARLEASHATEMEEAVRSAKLVAKMKHDAEKEEQLAQLRNAQKEHKEAKQEQSTQLEKMAEQLEEMDDQMAKLRDEHEVDLTTAREAAREAAVKNTQESMEGVFAKVVEKERTRHESEVKTIRGEYEEVSRESILGRWLW